MKSIILARVSTEEQKLEGQSLPAQIAKAREYAKLHGLVITADREFEFDESSTKDKRMKFDAVMEIIRKSKDPVALIVETIDRLQRSFKESVELDEMRKAGKLELHFIREGLVVNKESNSSAIQRWDLGVFVAKSFVLQIADNVKRTFEKKIANGEIVGKAPIGYLNVQKEDEKTDVEVDGVRAPLIVKIFETYASGTVSMAQVAEMTKKWGLQSNTAANRFLRVRDIEQILNNHFYYGWNRYKGKLYAHKYEPLIGKDLFQKCKDVRERYKKKPSKNKTKPFALGGLVQCSECGCAVTPELQKGRYAYYHCTNYFKKHKPIWVREEKLLEPIKKVFAGMMLNAKNAEDVRQSLSEIHNSKNKFYAESTDSLRKKHSQIEKRIEVMYKDRLDGRITAEQYDNLFQQCKEEQHEINVRLQKFDKADESFYVTANMVISLAERALQIFESSEAFEKKQLINFLLLNLKLDGKKLLYDIREPFAALVTANSTNQWGESWELNP